ncbi:MAG TPA: 7-cyano-7-deazaguanine synthase [Vicinamibacterales bacterium]|nr:7-cyano-7-deazaguanine synthase [Vicinamibacterales bacterium]
METSLVLCSAGLDSAVLVALEARERAVQPVYVSVGLAWEQAERAMLDRLIPALGGAVAPAALLTVDMRDVYPAAHWAVRGVPPDYDSPDEEVYLEGRNIVLLSKAAVFAAREGIARVALGPLAGNPFPDATEQFFGAMARALSIGLDRPIDIVTPLTAMRKADVIRLGLSLGVPLNLTMSCMNPQDGEHCGRCSKCRERHDGFVAAGAADPTTYASPVPQGD